MPESREVDAATDSGETCEKRPAAQSLDGERVGLALPPLDDASRRGAEIGNGRGEIGHHGLTVRTVVGPKTAAISAACRQRQEKRRHFRMGIDHLAEKRTQ